MRQLNLSQPSILPQIGLLTNVVELPHYDMIYTHNNIKEDARLLLKRESNHIFDKNAIEVFHNGFKIGYISPKVNAILARHMDAGRMVIAKVRNIHKQRFSPISGLEIRVTVL